MLSGVTTPESSKLLSKSLSMILNRFKPGEYIMAEEVIVRQNILITAQKKNKKNKNRLNSEKNTTQYKPAVKNSLL